MTTNIYGSEENKGFKKFVSEIKDIGKKNFKHFIIVPENGEELEAIERELGELSISEANITIIAKEDLKENECIKDLEVNINILFNDDLANDHGKITDESGKEEFFKKFREERIQHVNYDLNPNFEKSGDVSVNDKLAEKRQDTELLAAAHRFIAFEYYDDEKNAIKPKYNGLDLKKIHSSFEVESKVIDEARDAVCGGKYDKKTLNQAKKKSIYSGVDKFKASIDGDGYLVIQSVSDSINDEHFKKGVKTNFKFEEFTGTEITQDNLKDLFTNGSYGKDSGLSVLGAIELAFGALREIEKNEDKSLKDPTKNASFNAIFPKYGEMRRVVPELDDSVVGAEASAKVPGAPASSTPAAGAAGEGAGAEPPAPEAKAPEPVAEGSATPGAGGSEAPAGAAPAAGEGALPPAPEEAPREEAPTPAVAPPPLGAPVPAEPAADTAEEAARKAAEEEAAKAPPPSISQAEGSGVGKVQQQLPIIEGEESAKRSSCGLSCPSTSPKPSTSTVEEVVVEGVSSHTM